MHHQNNIHSLKRQAVMKYRAKATNMVDYLKEQYGDAITFVKDSKDVWAEVSSMDAADVIENANYYLGQLKENI